MHLATLCSTFIRHLLSTLQNIVACLQAQRFLTPTHCTCIRPQSARLPVGLSIGLSVCLSAPTAIRLCFCGFEIINSFCFPSLILVCIVLGHNSSRCCVLSLLCAVPSGFLSRCSCKPFYLASH